jgi:hypothetical protein
MRSTRKDLEVAPLQNMTMADVGQLEMCLAESVERVVSHVLERCPVGIELALFGRRQGRLRRRRLEMTPWIEMTSEGLGQAGDAAGQNRGC